MVATIGPASYNYEETVNTLRYANRAKNIKNKPKINEDPKDAMLRQFQEEIDRLKSMLEGKGGGGGKKGKKGKGGRRVTNEDGEEIEYFDDDPDAVEEFKKREQERLEQEKAAIMNNKSLIAEEKSRLLKELKDKEQIIAKEKETQEQLRSKLKAMESKLLTGGKNIVDHTNEQERRIQEKRY